MTGPVLISDGVPDRLMPYGPGGRWAWADAFAKARCGECGTPYWAWIKGGVVADSSFRNSLRDEPIGGDEPLACLGGVRDKKEEQARREKLERDARASQWEREQG